ncbi:uncharacterized protein LOC131615026 [Vicia villosa]|uniref:uncharacterized protein LOC131615026 n=1 Tax=Vicia villosa TaxID=3911 RepID=UPI00273BD84A|nr:uncharacterized protein LOC131615026 [Vicia villosa]
MDKVLEENIRGNNEVVVQGRRNASIDLWNGMNIKECMLRLKSCNLWLKEGDRNSRFFHNSIKERQRRNSITSLEGEVGRVEGVVNIKEEIRGYFHNFFKEFDFVRPVPESLSLNRLEESEAVWLEREFSEEAIRAEVWSCDGNKSPGPDGLYKILAKLLAARLRSVVGKLVSNNQTAFIPGRNISNGVLIVNEVLDLDKRERRSCMVLKVDFEKAYDKVSWNFVRYVLKRMGFGKRWLRWMDSCIFTNTMSILDNGSATKEFVVEKGLR